MWGVGRRREEIIKMCVVGRRREETRKDVGSEENEGGDQKRCEECGDVGKRSENMCGVWRRREEIIKMGGVGRRREEIRKDVRSVETGGRDQKRCLEFGDGGRRS
jgi:hypothetical protein